MKRLCLPLVLVAACANDPLDHRASAAKVDDSDSKSIEIDVHAQLAGREQELAALERERIETRQIAARTGLAFLLREGLGLDDEAMRSAGKEELDRARELADELFPELREDLEALSYPTFWRQRGMEPIYHHGAGDLRLGVVYQHVEIVEGTSASVALPFVGPEHGPNAGPWSGQHVGCTRPWIPGLTNSMTPLSSLSSPPGVRASYNNLLWVEYRHPQGQPGVHGQLLVPGGAQTVQVRYGAVVGTSPTTFRFSCEGSHPRLDDSGRPTHPYIYEYEVKVLQSKAVPSDPEGSQARGQVVSGPQSLPPGSVFNVELNWTLPEPASNVPNSPGHLWSSPRVNVSAPSGIEYIGGCGNGHCFAGDVPIQPPGGTTVHQFRVADSFAGSSATVEFRLNDSTGWIVQPRHTVRIEHGPVMEIPHGSTCDGLPCKFAYVYPVGETASGTLTVGNRGNGPLDINAYLAQSGGPFRFSGGQRTISPVHHIQGVWWATTTYDFTFAPTAADLQSSSCFERGAILVCDKDVRVAGNDPNNGLEIVRLRGRILREPRMEVKSSAGADIGDTLDLAAAAPGENSSYTIVVENSGAAIMSTYAEVLVSPDNPGGFELVGGPRQGDLGQGATLTFEVRATPTETGNHTAQLWISQSNYPFAERLITLRVVSGGDLVVEHVTGHGRVPISPPGSVDFGEHAMPIGDIDVLDRTVRFFIKNVSSQGQRITVSSTLDDPGSAFTLLGVSDVGGSTFAPITEQTLEPQQEIEVAVRLDDVTSPGPMVAGLEITNNAHNATNPLIINLAADVLPPPPVAQTALRHSPADSLYGFLAVDPTSRLVDFGNVGLGQVATGEVAVRNDGPTHSRLEVDIDGTVRLCTDAAMTTCTTHAIDSLTSPIELVVPGGFPLDLEAGQELTVEVRYSAAARGFIDGDFQFLTNDPNNEEVGYLVEGAAAPYPVPPLRDVSAVSDPVIRNSIINASYHELDLAFMEYLGPDIASWPTYAKHASTAAGQQMYSLQASVVLIDGIAAALDLNTPQAALPWWARNLPSSLRLHEAATRLLEVFNRQLVEATAALILNNVSIAFPTLPSEIITPLAQLLPQLPVIQARLLEMLDALGEGNRRIYVNIVPAYVRYLELANETPNGIPPTFPIADDPVGFLAAAFDELRLAKAAVDNAAAATTILEYEAALAERDRAMRAHSVLIGFHEQGYILQQHLDVLAPELLTLNGRLVLDEVCGRYHGSLLQLADNWPDLYSRLGLDGTFAPAPSLVTPNTLPPIRQPSDPLYRGTIIDYFDRYLTDTACIHAPPLSMN